MLMFAFSGQSMQRPAAFHALLAQFLRGFCARATGPLLRICNSLPGLLIGLFACTPAWSALTVDSVTLGGESTIAVAPGAAVPVTMSVTNDATYGWSATAWRISTSAPGTTTCYDHSNHPGANASASETFNMTAPVSAGTYNAYLVAASNSSCGGVTTLATLPNGVIVAAPTLAKTASSSSAVIGDTITFTVTATNPLAVPLNNVVVTDTLATGMTYSAYAATLGTATNAGQIVTWTIPSIPASGSAQLTLAITLSQQGTLINTASSTGATSATASIVVLPNAATHFRLDETAGSWTGASGEILDSGGTNLTGRRITSTSPTTTNVVSPSPTIGSQNSSVVASFCNAGSFDGKAIIEVAQNPLLQYTTKLSASAWIYATAYPTSDLYSILSNDQNYEFHINPSGKLFWWWNYSTLTSNTTIPKNKWTHIAITMDSSASGGRQRIYINGVQDSSTNNWKGTLKTNTCNFYIGGDVSTSASCPIISARNFRGMIDEVKLYNYELSASEVQADMIWGRTCSGAYDHIRIEHDGNGSTCNPETVTIKACLDSTCSALYPGNVTVNLSPSGWVGGNTFSFSGGVASRQLSITSGSTVTLGVTNASPTPNSVARCFNGSTETCSLNFAAASCAFDAVEPGASPQTDLYTKLASTAFNVDVLALNASKAVNTTFTGTVAVDLVDSSTSTCPSGGGLTSATSLTFAAADKGRKTLSFNFPNAKRNVRVRMIQGAGLPACSADNFAIRPQQFTVASDTMTNTALTGTPKAVAGTAFKLTASAGVTSGYDGTPTLDLSKVVDHNAAAIASGTLTGSFAAGTGADATGTNFKYLDVGNIQLTTDAVKDATYTSVDQTGDCVAGSTSNTLSGGKYGCNIGSQASAKMGRWYPSHYSFDGDLTPFCLGGNFTYMGQDALGVALTLKAHATGSGAASASDPVTSRYTAGYTNLAPVTVTGDNGGAAVAVTRLNSPNFPTMPNTALWSAGLFTIADTYSFAKLASPDGPYDAFKLKVALTDPDGSSLIGTSADKETHTTAIRYGRLRLSNAHGSELLDLPIPFEAQYWTSGGYYATNRLDSCTSFNMSSFIFSNFTNNLSACETQLSPTGNQTLSGGKLAMKLTKPGLDASNVPNRGSVQLSLNVGSTASGSTCVSGSSSAATAANLGWAGSNPSGTASFGIFRSPYIYFKESF
ncbi:MAG: putative mannose-sensitive agglutinin biosis protein MshQ [Proteobacteria bacterium]|nr:putative mannose-sensitive agglutinin biosis protein MshQ [Pseudomonadota bacterium]